MLSSRSVVVTKKAISLSITILFTINSLSFAQMPSKNALRERSTALSSSADIVDSLKHVDISSLTAQEIRERIPAYELLMKKADREYFDAVKELFDVSGITSFAKSSLSGIPVEVKVEKVPVMFKSLKMTPQEEEAMLLIYETGLYTPYAYGRCSVALRLLLLAGMHEDPLVPYKKAVVTFLKDKMDSFDKSYNGEDKLFLAFGLAVLGSNYKEIVPDYKDNIRSTLKTYRKSENIYYNMLSNTGLAILDGNLTADYIADILPKLDNALKKDDQDGKLLSAVIVAALGSVDEVILKTRRRDLLRVFKHVQYNSSKHDHLLSVIGLAAQSNKDSVSLFIKDSIANYDIDSESQGNSDYNLLLLLTGNSKDDKLLLALGLAVLGKNNKKILAEYQDMIRSILKSYRTSKNTHYKIFSNIGLGILDGNLTSDYIAGILLELKDDLENGDADSKLLSAVSIAILSRIEGVIHSKYRGRILSILKAALTSTGNYSYFSTRPDNGNHANQGYTYLLSVIGLTALSEEVESLYRITIEYPGTQKTDTIFGKDAYELADSLTQTIPKELGISLTALSDKNLKLLLKEDPAIETTGLDSLIPSGPMIADIDHKDMLESALSYTLSSAVETAKSSSGGTVEVSNRELNMVRERITDLMGKDGVRSTNSLTRAHARESLSRYDREIVTPLIGEHLSTSAQRLKEDMENAHSAAVDILEVSFQLWDAFYQAQERYHRAVISDIDKLIAAEDIANPPDKSLPTDKLDMSTILELNYLRQRIPYLLGKWGFRSTDPLKQRIAVSDLFLLNTMIANLGIDEQLSPKEKAFKAHIKNEAARFTLANRADYRSFPQEEYSRSIKGYYYGVVKIIDGIIDGESSVLNPRSSSAGISVKADNLELGSIDETINFLTSDKGLRSTRLLTRLAAAKALVIFDKEVIAPYMDKILTVLTGTDGLNNSDQWIRSGAAVALSRFGETVLLRYTVDINKIRTILMGNEGLRSSNALISSEAKEALYRFDNDLVAPYLSEDITILIGDKGLGSIDILEQVAAATALTRFDKDAIAPYIDKIIAILTGEDGLGSDALWIKTCAAEALVRLDKDTIAPYLKEILTYLTGEEGLESIDSWTKAKAAAVLQLIGKKFLPVNIVAISYSGLEAPITILAMDAYELEERLNQELPDDLNITCKAMSTDVIALYSLALADSDSIVVNIKQESMLEAALAFMISNQILGRVITAENGFAFTKAFSAGNAISKVGKGPELLEYLNSKEYLATIRELEYKLSFPQLDYRALSAMQMALLFRIDNSLFLKNRERILSVLEESLGDKDLYIKLLSMAGLASLSSLDADILLENKGDILSILETGMHSGISYYKLISAIGLLLLSDVDKNTSDKYFKMASAIVEKNLKGSDPSNRQLAEMASLVITGKDAPYAAGTDASFNDKMPELRLKDRDFSPPAGLPKSSSSDFNSRKVSKLEAINIDELMTLLTGEEGIKSADLFIAADAVDLISEFDKEVIERYIEIDEITDVFASYLTSGNPWTRAYAVAKLSGLDKDLPEPYIKDVIDFLRSNKAFGSSVRKTQLRAAAILSKFDRDLLGSYMNPDDIVQFLAGEKGFENSTPSTREYAAELLSGFGKDAIAPYIDIKRVTTSLVNYLEGADDPWRKARATSALQQLLGKDNFPVIFKLVFTGPDYKEPLTILVKDAYKLRDMLNQSLSPITGSSFIAVTDDSIRLLPHIKSSSAGDLSVDDLEDRVTFLVGEEGLGSTDERTRAFAVEYLLELPEKGYASHKDKIVAVLKDGLTNIDPVIRSDAAKGLASFDVGTLSEHGLDPLKVISALPFDMPIAPVGPTVPLSKSSSSGLSLTPEEIENIELAAKAANLSNVIGTIVYDDTKLSDEQQQKLQNLIGTGKDSLLTDLEAKLGGCKVRLMSQGGIEDNVNTIIISTEQLSGFEQAKFFIVEQASQDMARDMSYAKIVPLIAIAKGLLGLENINEHHDLYLALKAAIKSLSRGQLNDSAIEAAITAYITDKLIFIMLPLPTSYDYDNLEQLQRQALMVLIAA